MDWLLPLKSTGANMELRIALRSWVANGGLTEDDTLWVIGDRPRWLKHARHLPGNRFRSKPENVFDNILRACQHPDMPERVVVVNDDFTITEPADVAEVAYRGTLDAHIDMLANRGTWWFRSLEATRDYLHSIDVDEPLSYELHRPLVIDTAKMEQALREASWHQPTNPPQWRTVYGNRWAVGGVQRPDGKVYGTTADKPDTPFVSTTDNSFRTSPVAQWAASLFPDKCRFEA